MLHTLPASYQVSADPRFESMIDSKTLNCQKINWKTCKCEDSETTNRQTRQESTDSGSIRKNINSILAIITYTLIH